MIAKVLDGIGAVREEEGWIFGFDVVVLRRLPEVVPHENPIFVGQVEKCLFGALTHPVADDIESGVAIEPEERLEVPTGDTLAGVVHAPISAARGDAYAVHTNDEVRRCAQVGQRLDCWRVLRAGRQRGNMRVEIAAALFRDVECLRFGSRNFAHALVAYVDDRSRRTARCSWRILYAAQVACAVEQAQLVTDLADAKSDVFRVRNRTTCLERQLQVAEFGAAVSIGPP